MLFPPLSEKGNRERATCSPCLGTLSVASLLTFYAPKQVSLPRRRFQESGGEASQGLNRL